MERGPRYVANTGAERIWLPQQVLDFATDARGVISNHVQDDG